MSFIKTSKDVIVGAVTTGAVYLSDEARAEREKICRGCEIFIPSSQRCDSHRGGCNCYMPRKWKFIAAKCPKGKW